MSGMAGWLSGIRMAVPTYLTFRGFLPWLVVSLNIRRKNWCESHAKVRCRRGGSTQSKWSPTWVVGPRPLAKCSDEAGLTLFRHIVTRRETWD